MDRRFLFSGVGRSRACRKEKHASGGRLLPHLQAAAYPPPAAAAGPADGGEAAAPPRGRGLEGFASRHLKLSAAVCELVEDFGLVGFGAVAVEDSRSGRRVLVSQLAPERATYSADSLYSPPLYSRGALNTLHNTVFPP